MNSNFTTEAKNIWDSIPAHTKGLILSNAWCSHCRRCTTMKEYSGKIESGNLILTGICMICRKKVVRVLENEINEQ